MNPAIAQKQFGFDNAKPTGQPYLSPEETVKRMKVPPGFTVGLFAGEPMVVNPIAFTVDERGRLWVVECFEYPSRTPPGKMPRDRIVILEDTDGDGKADKRTVFCEGKDFPDRFDLASGIEVGYGGVFLGAPPYLWFIENKNDKPGKFEKLLSGFGSQDTHETLNTFQWGPDGWLYGLHGIFTTSQVNDVKMNAAVWRYHPRTKKFEQWAEGTSNPWGWDFRNTDGQMILCCCVIPHLFHIVPGGIYKRQAGASANPYAYGYINEICDHTFHKESGWAHAGLLSLDTPIMPKEYQESVIFGSIHGSSIKRNTLKRNGSTYTASRADDFLTSGDKNFRPINLRWGPNGEIYIIDWHDQNPCHQAKPETWDYERGRVYRIATNDTKPRITGDMQKLSITELMTLFWGLGCGNNLGVQRIADQFNSATPWSSRTATRLAHERRIAMHDFNRSIFNKGAFSKVEFLISERRFGYCDQYRIIRELEEYEVIAKRAPQRPREDNLCLIEALRAAPTSESWTLENVQWIGESARSWTAAERLEVISLAGRLNLKSNTIPIVHPLLLNKDDARDPVIPHMLWYAYEPHVAAKPQAELGWLKANAASNPLITDHILPRAVRRVVALGKPEDLALAVGFIGELGDDARLKALEGLVQALEGRTVAPPASWTALRLRFAPAANAQPLLRKLDLAFRDPAAAERAYNLARDKQKPAMERAEAVRLAAQLGHKDAQSLCFALLSQESDAPLRIEALRALATFTEPQIAKDLIGLWNTLTPALKTEAVNVLASRRNWARTLLAAVEFKKVPATDLNTNVVLRMKAFKDKDLDAAITRVWGQVRDASAEAMKLIEQKRKELNEGPASFTRGKKLFTEHCGKCHTFEGQGHNVGPALDGAARDIEYLLANILDPDRVVGAPYQLRRAIMHSGKIEEGMLHAEDPASVTLKIENDQLKVLQRKDIEELNVSEKSVMPADLTKPLSAQDFRDLIRYTMAHPYVIEWNSANDHISAPVTGAVPLKGNMTAEFAASAALATKLQLNAATKLRVLLDDTVIFDGTPGPDEAIDVRIAPGSHRLKVESAVRNAERVMYLRFLDPDRKLAYPEPKPN